MQLSLCNWPIDQSDLRSISIYGWALSDLTQVTKGRKTWERRGLSFSNVPTCNDSMTHVAMRRFQSLGFLEVQRRSAKIADKLKDPRGSRVHITCVTLFRCHVFWPVGGIGLGLFGMICSMLFPSWQIRFSSSSPSTGSSWIKQGKIKQSFNNERS